MLVVVVGAVVCPGMLAAIVGKLHSDIWDGVLDRDVVGPGAWAWMFVEVVAVEFGV